MIYIIVINGRSYAVSEKDIAVIREVHRVHRLPMSTPVMAGVASIEGERVNLFELAACLGYAPQEDGSGGIALFPAAAISDYAYLVKEASSFKMLEPESVHPLPDHLSTEVIHNFAVVSGGPVPIISLPHLYERLKRGILSPVSLGFPEIPGEAPSFSSLEQNDVTLLEIAGQSFAVRQDSVAEETFLLPELADLPGTPPCVSGIAWLNGEISTVLDPAVGLKIMGEKVPDKVLPLKAGFFSILTQGITGRLVSGEFTAVPVPLPFRSPLIQFAVIAGEKPVPVLEEKALAAHGGIEFTDVGYETASTFRDQFGERKIMLHVVELNGQRYGLPTSLVKDVLGLLPIRELPGSRPVVVGATVVKGSVLPVVDLERCFGGRSEPEPGWRMVLMKDGNFEALFLAESVLADCIVTVENQLDLPHGLDSRYVSGCFLEGEDLRLILDVPSFVVHITPETGQEDMMRLIGREYKEKNIPAGADSGEPVPVYRKKAREDVPVTEVEPKSKVPERSKGTVPEASHARDGAEREPASGDSQPDDTETDLSEDTHRGYPFDDEQGGFPGRTGTENEIPAHEPSEEYGEETRSPEVVQAREPECKDQVDGSRDMESSGQPDAAAIREGEEESTGEPGISADAVPDGTVPEGTEDTRIPFFRQDDLSRDEEGITESSTGDEEVLSEGPQPGRGSVIKTLILGVVLVLAVAAGLFFQKDIKMWFTGVRASEEHVTAERKQTDPQGTSANSRESRTDDTSRNSGGDGDRAGLFRPETVSAQLENVEGEDSQEQVPGMVEGRRESGGEIQMEDLVMKITSGKETVLVKEGADGLPEGTPAGSEIHTVKRGDTLWDIARLYTGDPFRYPALAEESDIEDPDLIYPGQRIFIVLDQGE